MKNSLILFCLTAGVFIFSCDVNPVVKETRYPDLPRSFDFDQAKFDKEYSAWNSINTKNYIFIQLASSPTMQPNKIRTRHTVEDGEEILREAIDEDEVAYTPVDSEGYPREPPVYGGTVSEIYRVITKIVNGYKTDYANEVCDYFRIIISYDEIHHYPTSFYSGMSDNANRLLAPSLSFKISDLVVSGTEEKE